MTTPVLPENNPLFSASETRFAVLLFTDIVGSTDLKAQHGVPVYGEALQVHNQHFERLARECRGIRILHNMGDGYFAEAGSVAEAVRLALLFQEAMRAGPWKNIRLTTRVGIHGGEVTALVAEGGSGVVAPAADLAARVMSLAVGGQILLTRWPFDEARHFLREHPAVAGREMPPLRWLAHGPYLLKGRDEPMEIFEVGAQDWAPLVPPPDSEKAKRAIRPGEEETLGWRPAIGLEIPGRPGWKLVELLGKGGFGEVWTGEHAKLRQRRAFKFCFDDERLRALKREVTLVRLLRTALGDRDDIVRFHELKLDEPPFYLESDLAPHGNLLQWAEKQGGLAAIPLAQRIALVAHTATALAAAHSIGVLHKDIKPTNILIFDAPDGTVRPRLVDFGIGTLADPAVLGEHGVTAAGFTRATVEQSTGTPTYSPPEYLAGKPYTVQGDIYGLGVLLYQLIAADSSRPIAPGWERDITDPLLREDIAACVDGDPARRLPSAADLADRLLHLDQRRAEIAEKERLTREAAARTEAEAATVTASLRATRLRKLAGAFAVLALLAVAGGMLAWVNQRKAAAMLVEAARSDRLVAEEKLRVGQEQEAFAHLARACEYDRSSTLGAEKAIAVLGFWDHVLPTAILTGHETQVYNAQFSPDGKRIVTTGKDQTARVWDAATGKTLATLAGHKGVVRIAQFSPEGTRIVTVSGYAQFSPDGKRILAVPDEKTVPTAVPTVWDLATAQILTTLVGHTGVVRIARFSPDGTRIVTAAKDKTARVWDAANGKTLATFAGNGGEVRIAQFSPDGTHIVTASDDKTASVWDAATGKTLVTFAEWVEGAQFSPDGRQMVTVLRDDKTVGVWDAATGKTFVTFTGHTGAVKTAQFSPDGTSIVTASDDKTARVWTAATGKILATFTGHTGAVRTAQFSPDGTRIVTASYYDEAARVWDAATGQTLATLPGHERGVVDAQFSPDGRQIVTVLRDDRTARVWDAGTGNTLATLAGRAGVAGLVQFSPDGTRIVTAYNKTARVWDLTTDKLLATTLAGHDRGVRIAHFSPDGTRLVTASDDNTTRVWDATTGQILTSWTNGQFRPRGTPTQPSGVRTMGDFEITVPMPAGGMNGFSAQFSPDGRRIVTASQDEIARVCDAATGQTLVTLAGHKGRVMSAQFSPDGTRLVTVSDNDTARVWDAATGKTLATLKGNGVGIAQFSPNGTRIVTTSSYDKTVRVWDAATGQTLASLAGHEKGVTSAQFSLDGTRVVTASYDKTARVWDAAIGKMLTILAGHEELVFSAQFSPNGTRIVTTSGDWTARLWDAITGKMLATLAGHRERVTSAQFSPDGTRIVTVLANGTVRMSDVLLPSAGPPPKWFPDFLRYMAQMRLNSDGELETLKAADWLALRERLRGVLRVSANADTPYLRILRKYVRE